MLYYILITCLKGSLQTHHTCMHRCTPFSWTYAHSLHARNTCMQARTCTHTHTHTHSSPDLRWAARILLRSNLLSRCSGVSMSRRRAALSREYFSLLSLCSRGSDLRLCDSLSRAFFSLRGGRVYRNCWALNRTNNASTIPFPKK